MPASLNTLMFLYLEKSYILYIKSINSVQGLELVVKKVVLFKNFLLLCFCSIPIKVVHALLIIKFLEQVIAKEVYLDY